MKKAQFEVKLGFFGSVLLRFGFRRNVAQFLFDTCRLALAALHVVQLRAAHFARLDKLNFLDAGAYDGENPLYTNAVGNFPYGKHLSVRAFSAARQHDALELLHTLLVTLADLNVDVDCIPCLEIRVICAFSSQLLFCQFD